MTISHSTPDGQDRDAARSAVDARRDALALPMNYRFTLGDSITPVQRAFLDEHGFVLFGEVATGAETARLLDAIETVEKELLESRQGKLRGIPLVRGRDPHGQERLQRIPFTSCRSELVRDFVRDPRFEPVRTLIGNRAQVGDEQLDGVVFNHYFNTIESARPGLGWHTDGLRDLAYLRMPGPMLNVGFHFDRIRASDGGLRIIPGSHRQGFLSMCFRKAYFLDHRVDPNEVAIETFPGDLTIHDGRTWHRVHGSPHQDARSIRRSMYVPYVNDDIPKKGENEKTPLYHEVLDAGVRLQAKLRKLRSKLHP